MFEEYVVLNDCDFCGKKATIFFFRKGIFSFSTRQFCKECALKHKRSRDDAKANFY